MRKIGHPLGKIKISRYLQYMENKNEADYLSFKHDIPSHNTRIRKKVKDEEVKFNQLGETYENWMNLGNDGKLSKSGASSSSDTSKSSKASKKNFKSALFQKSNIISNK